MRLPKDRFNLEDITEVALTGFIPYHGGLWRAIELYDPKRNAEFHTYAYHFIRGAILRYITTKNKEVKTSYLADVLPEFTEKFQNSDDTFLLALQATGDDLLHSLFTAMGISDDD